MYPDFDDMLESARRALESLRLPPEFHVPRDARAVFKEVGLDDATLQCIEFAALAMHNGRPRGAEKFRIEADYGYLMPEATAQLADGRHDWGWPK